MYSQSLMSIQLFFFKVNHSNYVVHFQVRKDRRVLRYFLFFCFVFVFTFSCAAPVVTALVPLTSKTGRFDVTSRASSAVSGSLGDSWYSSARYGNRSLDHGLTDTSLIYGRSERWHASHWATNA